MVSDKVGLDTRVGWVREEIELVIENIEKNLTAFVGRPDYSTLQSVLDQVEELRKTLKVSNIQGAEKLAEEIVTALNAVLYQTANDEAISIAVVQQALVQMSEYLQHLEEGYADLPIVILPVLNELRATHGGELLSELLVFLPEDGSVGNRHIGTDEFINIAADKREAVYKRLRMHYQLAMVSSFKGNKLKASLNKLQILSNDLIRIHESVSIRIVWWLSKALAEVLEHNKLEFGVAVKMMMGNLERLIMRLGQLDSGEHEELEGLDDLKRNLLYYIGMAEDGSPIADDVKKAFLLDMYLPKGENLKKLRKHYASPSQQLWRAVAESVNDDIGSIIDGFDHLTLNHDEGTLNLIIEKSRKTATTLGMLGLGKLAEIIDRQVDEFNKLKSNPKYFGEQRRIEVATEWLRVKDILMEYSETGEDATKRLFSDDGRCEISAYGARKHLLLGVEQELARVVGCLDSYEKASDEMYIHEVVEMLTETGKLVDFMGHEQIVFLLDGARDYLESLSEDEIQANDKAGLKSIADIIASVESSILALRNNTDYMTPLNSGLESYRQLGEKHSTDENAFDEIALDDVVDQVHHIKKQMRQNKLDAILAH